MWFFLPHLVTQLDSNFMKPVDAPELALARKPEDPAIPIELIRRQQSAAAAFSLACVASGLDDKEIYLQLKIDAGTFSRMKKGDATLQGDQVREFCRAVGNRIYLEWLAYQDGCTLVQIESETERQLRQEREARQAVEAENKLLRSLVQGRAV